MPHPTTIARIWLPRVFATHMEELKKVLAGRRVWIAWDESTDDRDWSVLVVLLGSGSQCFLVDFVKMVSTNHQTVAQAVVTALQVLDIPLTKVIASVSDSAAYCRKAADDVLAPLMANLVHVPCICHILALIGDDLASAVDGVVDRFVNMFQGLFTKQLARKRRLLAYLKEYLPPKV